MNHSLKHITIIYLLVIMYLLGYVSLTHQNTKIADKNRQQQICEQMKSFHPDCHIE